MSGFCLLFYLHNVVPHFVVSFSLPLVLITFSCPWSVVSARFCLGLCPRGCSSIAIHGWIAESYVNLVLSYCRWLMFPNLHREIVSHFCFCTLDTTKHGSMNQTCFFFSRAVYWWKLWVFVSGRLTDKFYSCSTSVQIVSVQISFMIISVLN